MADEVIGPTLPPNWKPIDSSDDSEDHNNHRLFGPVLPSGSTSFQPSVPPSVMPSVRPSFAPSVQLKASSSEIIGPSMPSHVKKARNVTYDSDSDSDDMIGPIPETHHKFEKINEKFGDVSEILAQKEAQKEVKREREEWMMVAPQKLASKIPTKSVKHFSQRPLKSYDKNPEKKYKSDDKRDKQLTQLMDSYNKSKKRDVSLIDIHNNETKKAKKSEASVEERIPFDREKDLSVRRMDARQTKSVLNKAKTFNDRFSLGINKFL